MYPSKSIFVRFMQKYHAVFVYSVGNFSIFSVIYKVVLTVFLLFEIHTFIPLNAYIFFLWNVKFLTYDFISLNGNIIYIN